MDVAQADKERRATKREVGDSSPSVPTKLYSGDKCQASSDRPFMLTLATNRPLTSEAAGRGIQSPANTNAACGAGQGEGMHSYIPWSATDLFVHRPTTRPRTAFAFPTGVEMHFRSVAKLAQGTRLLSEGRLGSNPTRSINFLQAEWSKAVSFVSARHGENSYKDCRSSGGPDDRGD